MIKSVFLTFCVLPSANFTSASCPLTDVTIANFHSEHSFEFEDFRLDAANPGLWRGNSFISISPKALETLILLVQNKGEIVSRDELIETVWKDTFVEEGNINYTISLLRKIFDNKDLIQTIPRRGYRFAAAVSEITQNGTSLTESAVHKPTPIPQKSSIRWIF